MKIDILTLFPEMFVGPLKESIIGRAQKKKLVQIKIHNLRNWTKDKHRTADDRPFGGGIGMVLMIEPVHQALSELKQKNSWVILLTPQGQTFKQKMAQQLIKKEHLILICGHYEGVDERIRQKLVDQEISIGDYVLTGGELPAMVVVDSVVRLLPGVLEKIEATQEESFSDPLLEYPQYTRPADFKGWSVPDILLSGNHEKIMAWRKKEALKRTQKRRPDLLKQSKARE